MPDMTCPRPFDPGSIGVRPSGKPPRAANDNGHHAITWTLHAVGGASLGLAVLCGLAAILTA